jgi:hypothetical protein
MFEQNILQQMECMVWRFRNWYQDSFE